VALWHDRQLATRFPYLEAGNEYPVGTGLLMGITALPASRTVGSTTDHVCVSTLRA
jgi:hypothetical protein